MSVIQFPNQGQRKMPKVFPGGARPEDKSENPNLEIESPGQSDFATLSDAKETYQVALEKIESARRVSRESGIRTGLVFAGMTFGAVASGIMFGGLGGLLIAVPSAAAAAAFAGLAGFVAGHWLGDDNEGSKKTAMLEAREVYRDELLVGLRDSESRAHLRETWKELKHDESLNEGETQKLDREIINLEKFLRAGQDTGWVGEIRKRHIDPSSFVNEVQKLGDSPESLKLLQEARPSESLGFVMNEPERRCYES